jgi:hypothetical protein
MKKMKLWEEEIAVLDQFMFNTGVSFHLVFL